MKRNFGRFALTSIIAASLSASAFIGCSTDDEPVETLETPLVAVCVADEPAEPLPADAWYCGDALVAECNSHAGAWVHTIYVDPPTDATCADPQVSYEGPFVIGDHTVIVTDADAQICTSELTVVDTTPPVATSLDSEIWPPNHKMVEIFPHDCVEVYDVCDAAPEVIFTQATSDEPANTQGDGNTDEDIVFTPDKVMVRAERMGGGDGRVYTLGWRVTDAAGHMLEGACQVSVPHDQGGGAPAIDSGVQYTVN